MALLGFTGSGQFAYLGFAHPDNAHIEYFTLFIIILGINLRYLPMTLSASAPLPGSSMSGILRKALLAHWLADESYAVERKHDGIAERAVIRLAIVACWSLTTTAGILLSTALPLSAREVLAGLTFPISAILILLSWDNIASFVDTGGKQKRWCALLACATVSVIAIAFIGPKYFWLPSIVCCYLICIRYANAGRGAGE